ncbi:YdeI family protein [Planomonospora sp. ID82291]|uniref:YdeI/OmpD-associated family protein n=1 Tax=Planomonospora sp. ID82291 TaxID=2738136 RepID=UPI0018C44185|nr:YdeI/OmpD-associated family protein [Planomonospora sp. ID82291]MBG0816456.1 YdeI/OmpD-associated family protein [Planomonospora sp. ID82291]
MMRFADAAQWESWLAVHHATEGEAWLEIARKGSGEELVAIGEALEVALCYGWIDSHRRSCDERRFLQRYSPRRRRSPWSRVNVERVEALTAAGRMRPPGLAEVAAAQADGRWASAYAAQREAVVPPDLAEALAADARAAARFEVLGATGRYRLVLPLLKARTAAGRAARLERVVRGLGGG